MTDRRARWLAATFALACSAAAICHAAVDRSAKPGDDFYGYANNAWLNSTRLPDGVARIDSTSLLRVQNAQRVRALIDEAVKARASGRAVSADARKIADYYSSRSDTAAIEAKGLAPLSGDLAAIAAIDDRHALAAWLGRSMHLDDGGNQQTESLFGLWVHQDLHDPYRYAAHLVQGGLGLADASDYLDPGTDAAARRTVYRSHIAKVLTLAGFDRSDVRAARVLDLEIAIAATHASRADTDDAFKTDNSWRSADFDAKAPGLDWGSYFSAAGIPLRSRFMVWQPGAVTGGARLVGAQPLDAWKDYLAFHLIQHYAAVLPRALSDGAAVPDPVAATEAAFGDAIGKLYVERYFSPRARSAATVMVENIRSAFRAHLARLTWMSPATRAKAQAKLAALRVGLGYPFHWVDYANLAVVPGDAFGNLRRAEAFVYSRELTKLGRPVDPDEWAGQLHPQMVGAILNISPNTMQFSAGLLRPPYFDADGDAAANYGSAGAGIAHEISHSFDELGNLYDARGRLGLWWTSDDQARFRAAAAPLAAQLDGCSPLPALHAHGTKILPESTADLGGLAVAYDAYHLSLRGRSDIIKGGLTGDQRFFVAFAERWRRLQTDASLLAQNEADNHAPPRCRSELVRNSDAWVRAFHVRPGDKLYVPRTERIRIW